MTKNAIQIIKMDHREVRHLYAEYEAAHSDEAKKECADQILKKLAIHAAIEEDHFYPAVREAGDAELRAMIDEARTEHQEAKLVINELMMMDLEDESYDAKMDALMETIQYHIEEGEQDMLPRAETMVSERKLEQLGQKMLQEKEKLANSPLKHTLKGLRL
jgi:hemerythrin superfamily protein